MKYTVDLDRDESGWWVASVRDLAKCHTQGRSIRQALSRIREAIALCAGETEAASAELEERLHLPRDARLKVARYRSACRSLEREQEVARVAADEAVEFLTDELQLSVRDAADVLGLSHQRVHQLMRTPRG